MIENAPYDRRIADQRDKDEWEVARLYARPEFRQELERTFEGSYSLRFHVGAWPFARTDATTGKPVKAEVGPWLMTAFRVMARLKGLRGTWLDPFRSSPERRLNAKLLAQYEADIALVLERLDAGNHQSAVKLAALPEKIRGYGHVRETHAASVTKEHAELLEKLRAPATLQEQAA